MQCVGGGAGVVSRSFRVCRSLQSVKCGQEAPDGFGLFLVLPFQLSMFPGFLLVMSAETWIFTHNVLDCFAPTSFPGDAFQYL